MYLCYSDLLRFIWIDNTDYSFAGNRNGDTSQHSAPSHIEPAKVGHHFNFTPAPQISVRGQLTTPVASSPTNTGGPPGGKSKWFNNIKEIVTTKSTLNVAKVKGVESPSPPPDTSLKSSAELSISFLGHFYFYSYLISRTYLEPEAKASCLPVVLLLLVSLIMPNISRYF